MNTRNDSVTTQPLRPGLPPVPPRMRKNRIDARGYPVPWFVWIQEDGTPEFRVIGPDKIYQAIQFELCWLCGERLGQNRTFVIGPMCAVNRTTSEPPCHTECAHFAVQACPFMILPAAKRREANLPENHHDGAGIPIKRNPGATCLWTITRGNWRLMQTPGGILFRLGDPVDVEWWSHGRPATRAEVCHSIDTGEPLLREMCDSPAAHKALDEFLIRVSQYLPAADLRPSAQT